MESFQLPLRTTGQHRTGHSRRLGISHKKAQEGVSRSLYLGFDRVNRRLRDGDYSDTKECPILVGFSYGPREFLPSICKSVAAMLAAFFPDSEGLIEQTTFERKHEEQRNSLNSFNISDGLTFGWSAYWLESLEWKSGYVSGDCNEKV